MKSRNKIAPLILLVAITLLCVAVLGACNSNDNAAKKEDKLLVFKITEEIDEHSVQMIRGKADYEIKRYMPKRIVFDFALSIICKS